MPHRRQRHLNPAAAGAVMSWDARFVAGNDGDNLPTISSRAGGTISGTCPSSYAVLKTGIRAGNSVMRFAYSQYTLDTMASLTSGSLFIAWKNTNASAGDNIFALNETSDNRNTYLPYSGDSNTYDSFFSTTRKGPVTMTGMNQSDWNIYCATSASSAWANYVNGGALHSTGTNTVSAPSAGRFGFSFQGDYGTGGDIGAVYILNSSVSAPLRRRIEQSLAFSWKISCA